MQNDAKIEHEQDFQSLILDICLSIIDKGYSEDSTKLLVNAVNDYNRISPEVCDLSVAFFVQYVYTTIIQPAVDKSQTGFILTVHEDSVIRSFIYHAMQREMLKIEYCNEEPCDNGPRHNEGPKNGCCRPSRNRVEGNHSSKLGETYQPQLTPQRQTTELTEDHTKDPIVMRKAADILNYRPYHPEC